MSKLVKAVLNVMKAVKNIEKTKQVGTGRSAYNAVEDKIVKQAFSKEMAKNGLIILPIEVSDTVKIESWKDQSKHKQNVLCTVKTKYKLMHESGEYEIISGYGHGVDTQDKAAGKATTYALKYALLYTFMTPTGSIHDTDNTHSEDIEPPKKVEDERKHVPADKVNEVAKWAINNNKSVKDCEKHYILTEDQKKVIYKFLTQ